MTSPSSDILASTKLWFVAATPDPTPEQQVSQLGVHFEEVKEMLDELSSPHSETQDLIQAANEAIHRLADHLKANPGLDIHIRDRIGLLDAVCDQIVTATGTAHVFRMDPINGMIEVNRSNWSKFDKNGQPIRNPDTHKIMKGPDYSPANLAPYV